MVLAVHQKQLHLKKRLMKELKEQLERDASSVQTTTAYFVTLPIEDAHYGHLQGKELQDSRFTAVHNKVVIFILFYNFITRGVYHNGG